MTVSSNSTEMNNDSPKAQTIEELKAEVADLKTARTEELLAQAEERKQTEELERLTRQKELLEAGTLPSVGTTPVSLQRKMTDIENARVRTWAYALGAYFTGPILPGVIAARTKNWTPFWAGLALGVVSLPVAFADLGIISSIPAAALGTALQANKSNKKREELGIVSPEEADLLRFKQF